jgi:hypothetical protein
MEPLAPGDPQQVGVYRLRFRLGSGGMGRVYLGFSPAGRAVAVKVIRPEFARNPDFVRRFGSEVRAAEAVSGAYTAPVVAAGPDDDPPWLATVFVAGPSLSDVVAEAGPMPEPAVWRLAGGLAEALQGVHARGLVHRDLKPANVLLAADGPRVIDFGISRALEGTAITATSMTVGTPAFMSPEQAQGRPVGPPSDVFSLGSVITFAATGAAPFGGGEPLATVYRVVHAEPDLSGLPAPFRDLVTSCLAKDPASRPTLTEVMEAVVTGSAAYPGASVTNFWPEPVAGLVTSRQDSVRAQVPASAGFAATEAPAPHEPTAAGTPAPHEPTGVGAPAPPTGPLRIQSEGPPRPPADAPVGAADGAADGHSRRRRIMLLAGTAAAVIVAGAGIGAVLAATSHGPSPSPAHTHTAAPAPTAQAVVQKTPRPSSSPTPAQAATSYAPTPPPAATAPATTTPPTTAPPVTVTVCTFPATGCSSSTLVQMKTEPSQIVNSGDGTTYVKVLTWSAWGSSTATGSGTLELNNCTPSCAAGTYTGYPATVTLSGLVSYSSSAQAYASMVISAPGSPNPTETYTSGLVP